MNRLLPEKLNVKPLLPEHLDAVTELFVSCFEDDHYYAALFPNPKDRKERMAREFRNDLAFCISRSLSLGLSGSGGDLIAFLLLIDYQKVKRDHAEAFMHLFGSGDGKTLRYAKELHSHIDALKGSTLFIVSAAVREDMRRLGVASALLDHAMRLHPDCSFAGDVSERRSLPMYLERGFDSSEIAGDYTLVIRENTPSLSEAEAESTVKLIVPATAVLDSEGIRYAVEKEKQLISGFSAEEKYGVQYFVENGSSAVFGVRVSLPYGELLKYQRFINVCQYREHIEGGCFFYSLETEYFTEPLINATLSDMLRSRKREWSVIPDVFIAIPVRCTDDALLPAGENGKSITAFEEFLRFRTLYEAGIPSCVDGVDDLAGLKKRIHRRYLGKLPLRVVTEPAFGSSSSSGEEIGPPAYTEAYIAFDDSSACGVLELVSFSCPFLISQLLDSVMRNQLTVCDSGGNNLYDYIKQRFGLIKHGTPKSFVLIPEGRECLSDDQLASVLLSETIYPEGENFGRIIDTDIMEIVRDPDGMGQYDRACVYAYRSVVVQFAKELRGSLELRAGEMSITAYYIELLLFEEAAIHIANREINGLFTAGKRVVPIDFLKQVERIYDDFSRTMDFWDVKMNYPSSQKSMLMLRSAFRIDDMRQSLEKNREYLQTVFDTKCDIIDRRESKRMNVSLAIISFLAIFSALIDGHQYISEWLSGGKARALQIVHLSVVLLIFLYAAYRLLAGKTGILTFFRSLKNGRKKRRKITDSDGK